MVPQLLYAENETENEVACSVQFVPTFEPIEETFTVVKNEKPNVTSFNSGSDFHFIFLVDRSGSMQRATRLNMAIEALMLFIKSLPEGCTFNIISFGSNYQDLTEYSQFENEKPVPKVQLRNEQDTV